MFGFTIRDVLLVTLIVGLAAGFLWLFGPKVNPELHAGESRHTSPKRKRGHV
jgi:hypothetical protein